MLALLVAFAPRSTASAEPWLFVSDIHDDPRSRSSVPSRAGSDTNTALLDSTIAEMRRVAPHAPVVIIPGDFLAHYPFSPSLAHATMQAIATRFDRAFPDAQFVIALGNEDSACGDYALAPGSPFLRDVATIWAPLVNRHGAAPRFGETFVRDGFYTATLPLAHTNAVVIDDIFWSPRYKAQCTTAATPPDRTLAELRAALEAGDGNRHWVVAHIPPGIDAFTTARLLHQLAIAPLLAPDARNAFLHLIDAPAARVALVLDGHTHRFAYRIAGTPSAPIPMLLVPAVSPVYRNAPSFLTVDVDPDGTIRRADEYAYARDGWHDIGGTASLGLHEVTGASLTRLQGELATDRALQHTFDQLYAGGWPEIGDHNRRVYWCAATAFETTSFRDCLAKGGYGVLLPRGIAVAAVAFIVAVAAIAGVLLVGRRRRANARRTGH